MMPIHYARFVVGRLAAPAPLATGRRLTARERTRPRKPALYATIPPPITRLPKPPNPQIHRRPEPQPAQFARFSLFWALCKRFQNCKKIPRQRRGGESRSRQIFELVVCRFLTAQSIFSTQKNGNRFVFSSEVTRLRPAVSAPPGRTPRRGKTPQTVFRVLAW